MNGLAFEYMVPRLYSREYQTSRILNMLVKVHCLSNGLLTVQGTREKQFAPEALGNAKIHLIIIFDGGGERTFFQGELSPAPQN